VGSTRTDSATTDANAERGRHLRRLADEAVDLLVVGGGITGCGIARDAAARGLTVALVEKRDFASGTSSKSSKLVHGGLRYLEQAELGLVFESVNERKRLMRLGRHLVRPLPFLVANYRGDRRWLVTLEVGLWIYDALCLFGSYRNHRAYGARRTSQLEPALRRDGLNGAILFYDCLTDDARLTLENALDARALGASVLNHVRALRLLSDSTGRLVGAEVEDEETGARIEVRARVVVNATGPWTDEVRSLAGEASVLKPTKGVHLVVDAARLPIRHALMMASPRDGRVVFAIPWGLGRTVVGTTDTFFEGSPDDTEADAKDVDYLLETANAYAPDVHLTPDDVLSTWAGLRPLLKPPDEGAGASQVSREHMLYERPGFITIAGGKLTTYRKMAAEVVDRVAAQLDIQRRSATANRPLPGAVGLTSSDDELDGLVAELERDSMPPDVASLFATTYGARAKDVAARVVAGAGAETRLDPELPYLMAQVDEAVEVELARSLEDVLSRRLQLALRGRDQGLGVARAVAERMAGLLDWPARRIDDEVADYLAIAERARSFRR
jgi:glycerol-3-phosphate dehydrogenase